MAASPGRAFLLKLGTAAGGTTIAGMRTTSFSAGGEAVEITNKDSDGWRELLAAAGTRQMSISASGVLSGNGQATTLLGYVTARSINAFGIVFDNGDTLDGAWQMTQFQAAGEHNGEQTYDVTLESSGPVTVTPAA